MMITGVGVCGREVDVFRGSWRAVVVPIVVVMEVQGGVQGWRGESKVTGRRGNRKGKTQMGHWINQWWLRHRIPKRLEESLGSCTARNITKLCVKERQMLLCQSSLCDWRPRSETRRKEVSFSQFLSLTQVSLNLFSSLSLSFTNRSHGKREVYSFSAEEVQGRGEKNPNCDESETRRHTLILSLRKLRSSDLNDSSLFDRDK
jgi:hypothetical protein